MKPLTPRQLQIYELIRSFQAANGYPPTRSEIARTLGFSSANAAEQHLRALTRKGVIELQAGASRGIRLCRGSASEEDPGLPIVGRVAAGSPLLAEEHIEQRYPLDAGLFSPRAHYLLRVRGMSMKDAGILDGDLLAVHRTTEVRENQLVVARLHDEVTVKRWRQRGHRLSLLADNPDYAPIEVDLRYEPIAIEGTGVGVIRPEIH